MPASRARSQTQLLPPISLWRRGARGLPKVVVASCLIVEDGRVLLVREASGHEARRWNLPGGKADSGESLVAAAVRETQEETGYRVTAHSLLGLYQYRHRTGDDRVRAVFWADVVGGKPRANPKEIAGLRWLAVDALDGLPDRKLAKPALLRAIFADLHASRRRSLHRLTAVRPALVA